MHSTLCHRMAASLCHNRKHCEHHSEAYFSNGCHAIVTCCSAKPLVTLRTSLPSDARTLTTSNAPLGATWLAKATRLPSGLQAGVTSPRRMGNIPPDTKAGNLLFGCVRLCSLPLLSFTVMMRPAPTLSAEVPVQPTCRQRGSKTRPVKAPHATSL
jgi:hypothetical protein